MDILVLSDSHGHREKIEEALARQIKKPDAVIFLGDGLRDIERSELGSVPVFSVSGNCDAVGIFYGDGMPTEQNLIFGDKRVFFTHGHRYGVKSALSPLIVEGVARDADIILFGHTHEAFEMTLTEGNDFGIKVKKPIYILNPGSVGSYPYRFGCIHIGESGEVLLSHGILI